MEKKKSKKRGNPNWFKGMNPPNPYGRKGKPTAWDKIVEGFERFFKSGFTQ
jgi:hypothetical protein